MTDGEGKPLILLLSEGQMSDHKGARPMLDALPHARSLTGDKGYDSDGFRKALIEKGIEPCIPPKRNRKIQHDYDKALYKKRHKIENAFGWLKDWRRIATRYDRCAHLLLGDLHRGKLHLLPAIMSPEPSITVAFLISDALAALQLDGRVSMLTKRG